ncbi:MAG: hypothetical protein WCR72_09640 [Bacteroidota bacterium]
MNIAEILQDKLMKPKEKTEMLTMLLSGNTITIDQLINFASSAKDADKASCIEVVEHVSLKTPSIVNQDAFGFVTRSLAEKAPRIKWESARVVGNTAHLFEDQLEAAIRNLLENSEHAGTVVRWSAAYALGQIVKLKLPLNAELVPAVEAIAEREDKNSIRKIYLDALKKSKC